jgi:pantothenate synthetase
VVAKEFVNEMKFDNPADYHKYFITFKDKITKSLDHFNAKKAAKLS